VRSPPDSGAVSIESCRVKLTRSQPRQPLRLLALDTPRVEVLKLHCFESRSDGM